MIVIDLCVFQGQL